MGHEMMAGGTEEEKQLRWDGESVQESMPASSSSVAATRGSSREGKHQQHLHQMDAMDVRRSSTAATNTVNTPSASTRSNSTASSSAAWTHSQAVSPSSSHSGVETVSEEHRSFKAVGANPSSFSSAILSQSPLSPSTDPSSQLLVNALTAEATRQGFSQSHQRHQRSSEDSRAAQSHSAGGPSEESRNSSGRASRQEEHGKGASGGLSPFGAYKLPAVAGTANETAEPTWSRPSSGPASAYSSPHAKTSPLPTNAATYAKISLSHAAAGGDGGAAGAGGLTTPSAYHRAMSTSAAEALNQNHRSVSQSSSLAHTGANSPVPVATPSATGSLTPDPTSSGHATNHKMTPSGSGHSSPSHGATSSQMSHGDTISGSGKPHVLETHRLQLQTHKPSGRRMINQYIIEDELGRGVHGKVRMAWDTETGERVAVKIVERQSRKRLGGSTDWSARIAAKRKAQLDSSAASRSPEISDVASGKGKGKANDSTRPSHQASEQQLPGSPSAAETGGSTEPKASSGGGGMRAHFAPSPPRSPGSRFVRWGQALPSRDDHEDAGNKKDDKMKKSLLWTTDKKVKREIAIMKKCAHENVVRLREVIDDPQSKKIFMVLEYMAGGEIQWKDEFGRPRMTVDEARRTIRDVVLGLEYLHYQGIIHRDIKPANLLWDEEKRVKISDFGVSHYSYALLVASGGLSSSSPGETRDPSLMDDRELAKTAGSPAFFAPELCLAGDPALTAGSTTGSQNRNSAGTGSPSGNSTHSHFPFDKEATSGPRPPRITKAIDVWALGVTLFCLLFGELPFTAPSEFALFNIIPTEDYKLPIYMGSDKIRVGPRKPRWKGLPEWEDEEPDVHPVDPRETVPDVDPSMLSEDARQLRHLLDRLLEKDPEKRIKLEEVKKHPWVTRGLQDTPAWLSATAPEQHPFVEVTHEEVEDALTGFSKIKQRVKRWQSKLFDTLGGRSTRSRSHSQTSSSKPYVGTPSDRLTPGTDDFGSVRSTGGKSPKVSWFGKRSVPPTPGGSSVSPSVTYHRSAAFGMTPNLTGPGEVHSKAVPHHEVDALLQRIISDRSANSPSVTLPTASTRSTSSERRSIFERRVSKDTTPPAASARTSSLVRPLPARCSSESATAGQVLLEGSAPVSRDVSNMGSARQSFDGARPSGIPTVERRVSRNRLGDLFHFGRSKGGSVSRQNSRRSGKRDGETNLKLDVVGAVDQAGASQPANTPSSAPILSMQSGVYARSSMDALHSLPASQGNFFASRPGSPPLVVTSLNEDEHDVDLELDLSDDDLGDEQNDQVLRNSGNGWRLERFSHTSTDDAASLTPSVEGGYNLFKPEYTGKTPHEHYAIGQPREAIEKESPSPHYGYGYYDSGALDKVHSPSSRPIPASGSAAETMIVHSPSGHTEDSSRFADADESHNSLAAELELAAARGRFEEGEEVEDEEDEEEEDGCVSFRAGRSSRSTTISRQLSRVTSRDGTR